jgi:hypothetical protein
MAILSVKAEYTTIQEAVDAAVPGDTVLVESGIYSENVIISTNALRIEGECGAVLDGGFELDYAFYVNGASNVQISSFEIRNYVKNGIAVNGGSGVTVSDCSVTDCLESGVYAENSELISVSKTLCSGCGDYGLSFRSVGGSVSECIEESCGEGGMFFFSSGENEVSVTLSSVTDCPQGIEAYGTKLALGLCKLHGCAQNGVVLQGGNGSSVEKCTLCACRRTGLNLSGAGHRVAGNRVYQSATGVIVGSECVVSANEIKQSAVFGLVVSGTGNTVENNTVAVSGRADIVRYYAGNVFRNNSFERSVPPCLDAPCPPA